ncbi:hypothetical protein, partial [Lactococcus petauri]|uniref:hypothetical protein n=1 Tax=Lactococcus petauri TaxID=1940789 RepID=UPI0021F104EB
MNAEEKEIAKQQFNILNLTAMLSPMKKEDIAAWIQNLKMDAWEKEEPYRSKIREIYNSAESSVG